MAKDLSPKKQSLTEIMQSAQRLGIELNEGEAEQWLSAISAAGDQDDIVFDHRQGIFGHKITMLDFSPDDLAHFRKLGQLVEFEDIPGTVETALALSGSAAQSKIQTYPGDADYFERINILACDRETACRILGDIIREKALDTAEGPTYQLMEVRFGTYPENVIINGQLREGGSSMSWSPEQIEAGYQKAQTPDGESITIHWNQAGADPGWCKLDWVVADPVRGQLVNTSNMLDVTWEAPDGSITPLDGFLDPYFQEIYLDRDSAPIFSKLSQHVSGNALDDYVGYLEKEVSKYLTRDINYGKAAKRMYNIFRLTARFEEAAIIRELFDEPTTLLYKVWALIRTIDESIQPGSSISLDSVRKQADGLILDVIEALEGGEESIVVRHLLQLRSALEEETRGEEHNRAVEAARDEVINLVNNFFYEKLTTVPQIKAYMARFELDAV